MQHFTMLMSQFQGLIYIVVRNVLQTAGSQYEATQNRILATNYTIQKKSRRENSVNVTLNKNRILANNYTIQKKRNQDGKIA
jgi:hypothetical protein